MVAALEQLDAQQPGSLAGVLSRVRQQVEVANRQLSATARAQSGSPAPVLQGDFATPRAGGSPAGGVPSMGRAYTEEFTACG